MSEQSSSWEGRDPVARVETALQNLGYAGEVFRSEVTIFTVEDASRAIGARPEEILKTILLLADGEPLDFQESLLAVTPASPELRHVFLLTRPVR